MIRRVVLFFAFVIAFAVPPCVIAQCNLSATYTTSSPGNYVLRYSAGGSFPPDGGSVEIFANGGSVATCPKSPCVVQFGESLSCTTVDINVGATCFDATGQQRSQSTSLHIEPDHQPKIAATYASPTAGGDGSVALSSQFQVTAPAAWTNRVVEFQWLPDLIDGGSVRIGDTTPDTFTVNGPSAVPPGQKMLKATIVSCGDAQDTAVVAVQDPACCCSASPTAPTCVAHPISVGTGNMRMADADPLPAGVAPLSRTYDSSNRGIAGRFGMGWRSFLDRGVTSVSVDGFVYLTIDTADGETYVFRGSGSTFAQVWPRNGLAATLVYDGIAGTYTLHEPLRDTEVTLRASDGLPLKFHSRSTRRDTIVGYSGSLPVTVADSWGNWSWTVSTDSASGRVTAISVDGTANAWQYGYDGAGRLTSVQGSNNAAWRTYAYGSFGMTEARDAAGRLIESHAYSSGRATSSLSAEGDVTAMTYNLSGDPLETGTRVQYATGTTTMYYVQWLGGRPRTTRIVGSCSGCGTNDGTYAYDVNGNILREQDARGYVSTRGFDALGRMTSFTAGFTPAGCDPATDANQCRLSSAALAAATLAATPSTVTTDYVYGDANWPDRPTQVTTASVASPQQSRIATYTYDAVTGTTLREQIDGWTSATAPVSIISTTALYDGVAAAAFDPGGAFNAAWLSLAQPAGLERSFDGPRTDVADVTQWVYYPIDGAVPALLRGHLAAIRDAAGNVTRFEGYDAFGHPTRVVDPNGVATESAYDAAGRLLTSTLEGVAGCDTAADPLCATDLVTQRSYSPALGPLASETRPNGAATTYEYDDRRRMTAMTRAVSASAYERAEYDYDAATGKRSAERYESGTPGAWTVARSEAYAYDAYARLREIDHPDNTKVVYTYDPANNIVAVQDERHASANTTYAYDPLNRLAFVRQTLGGGSVVTQYGYDVAGNLTSVVDPNGNTTAYAFDDLGRLLQQNSAVTGTTAYAYDAAGNLVSSTDANGSVVTRAYDALGRVTQETSVPALRDADPTTTWSYDDADPTHFGRGRVAAMSDASGTASYRYERRGLLASEVKTIGGQPFTSAFQYDTIGDRSFLRYPSARTVTWTFDYAGRPISASAGTTTLVAAAAYLPFGPLTDLTFGNGTARHMTYDNRYRPLTNVLNGGGGTVASYAYHSDEAGNITGIDDQIDPSFSRSFAYDDLQRLTAANSGEGLWGNGSYTYDAMGQHAGVGPRRAHGELYVRRNDAAPSVGRR